MDQSETFFTELNALIAVTHKLLDEAGIKHWIDFGTLLSAHRDQTLIPWDYDADISYLHSDQARILALDPQLRAQGYHVIQFRNTCLRVQPTSKEWLHVDLYDWKEQNGILTIGGMDYPNLDFPMQFIESLDTVILNDNPYPCPTPIEQFLVTYRYGPDYRRPVCYPQIFDSERICLLISPTYLTPEINDLLNKLSEQEAQIDRFASKQEAPVPELLFVEEQGTLPSTTVPTTTSFYQIYLKITPIRLLYRRVYRFFHRSHFYRFQFYGRIRLREIYKYNAVLFDLKYIFQREKPTDIQAKRFHYLLLRQQKRYARIIKKQNKKKISK